MSLSTKFASDEMVLDSLERRRARRVLVARIQFAVAVCVVLAVIVASAPL